MAHFEDPPPNPARVLLDAVEMARENPGRWVMVKTYKTQAAATVAGSRLKGRLKDGRIETRSSGAKLYLRALGVETK